MNDDSRLIVVQPPRQSVILVIIIVIIIIVVLIILLILLRRRVAASNTSTGSGSTQCANDVDCSGTQVCDTTKGVCVDCIGDANCPINAPVCDSSSNKCVGCLSDSGCPINKPHCDPFSKQCSQCITSTDCGGVTPFCNTSTHTCVGCLSAADCTPASPICAPGTNTCVECLSNSQCAFPATCVSGTCCNTSAPTITSLTADFNPPSNPHFGGTYSFSQAAGSTAVFQVLDPSGFLIYETPGAPATGAINIFQPTLTGTPRFYSGYSYLVRVRISQPCGASSFSGTAAVSMPYASGVTVPVIDSVGGNTGGFTVTLSSPTYSETLFCALYQATVWVIPFALGPAFDLNRAASQQSAFCQGNPPGVGPKIDFSGSWPFPVATGEQYWIRVTGQQNLDWVTPSGPVLFTIP